MTVLMKDYKRRRAQEAFAWRERGLTYPAIATKMRCSLTTARHYVNLWERHMRQVKRAQAVHMQWFGRDWDAPVNQECDRVEIPVGAACIVCGLSMWEYDQGVLLPRLGDSQVLDPVHQGCFLYAVGAA